MLKDIKLGFKLLKYSYNFKTNIGFMIFVFVIGVLMMLIPIAHSTNSFIYGSIYIFIGYVILLQMSYNLMFAGMVSATPHRKMFELTFPNVMTFTSAIIWYMILVLMVKVLSGLRPALSGEYNVSLVVISVFMLISMVYYGICYKFFILGTILFITSFFTVYLFGRGKVTIFLLKHVGADLLPNFMVGLILIVAGSLLSCMLRKLFYKRALSPMAMGAVLRKAMQ